MKILFLGPPGAGKGTQSQIIANKLNISHLSTGDLLRQAVIQQSTLGIQVQEKLNQGKLVPDTLIAKLVIDKIKNMHSFILDGFPRNLTQAQVLKQHNINFDYVFTLSLQDNIIIERLSNRRIHLPSGRCYNLLSNPPKIKNLDDITQEPLTQRKDDKIEIIKDRLQIYHQETTPVIDFYKKIITTKYIELNASKQISIITQQIDDVLNNA